MEWRHPGLVHNGAIIVMIAEGGYDKSMGLLAVSNTVCTWFNIPLYGRG
jgi:hypothetical protein